MTGDERRRFCADCGKHVYNLAEMTRPQVETLIAATGGHFCARLVRLPDGRVQTKAHEVVSRPSRLRASRAASVVVSALLSVSATTAPKSALGPIQSALNLQQQTDTGARSQHPVGGSSATVVGSVYDIMHAVIPGATVRLIDEKTRREQTVNTSEAGEFEFRGVEAGSYLLKVESRGFVTFDKPHLELRAHHTLRFDVTLQVGAMMGEVVLVEKKGLLHRLEDTLTLPFRKLKKVFTTSRE